MNSIVIRILEFNHIQILTNCKEIMDSEKRVNGNAKDRGT